MPSCDICGKEGYLVSALIEGTVLNVCEGCAIHGKILKRPSSAINSQSQKKEKFVEEKTIDFVSGYGSIIRREREKLGLTQKDFAMKINEKESTIQKIENEKIKPTIDFAKKFERIFGIKIIEEVKEEEIKREKKKEKNFFTLGDFIKV